MTPRDYSALGTALFLLGLFAVLVALFLADEFHD